MSYSFLLIFIYFCSKKFFFFADSFLNLYLMYFFLGNFDHTFDDIIITINVPWKTGNWIILGCILISSISMKLLRLLKSQRTMSLSLITKGNMRVGIHDNDGWMCSSSCVRMRGLASRREKWWCWFRWVKRGRLDLACGDGGGIYPCLLLRIEEYILSLCFSVCYLYRLLDFHPILGAFGGSSTVTNSDFNLFFIFLLHAKIWGGLGIETFCTFGQAIDTRIKNMEGYLIIVDLLRMFL